MQKRSHQPCQHRGCENEVKFGGQIAVAGNDAESHEGGRDHADERPASVPFKPVQLRQGLEQIGLPQIETADGGGAGERGSDGQRD